MRQPLLTLCLLAAASILPALEEHPLVPAEEIQVPEGLEVTVWAKSPLLFNPTNMDTDAQGRIWVAEGVNYRRTLTREAGDRIVVLEDTNGDGAADSSHTFVQDPELISPLGVSVFDNKIVVAQPPHILVYTDVDRDLKFDPAIDKREEFLSGFNARNHDHSLHATVAGPDGNWYFNQGNCGAKITDKDGRVFQSGGPYYNSGAGTPEWFNDPNEYAGKPSADGNIYNAGFAGRISPDGSGLQIVGHGFRNSYELCVNSFGDIFQNDNDDPPACRNTWLMEGGNLGFFSADGTRVWQTDRRPGQPVTRAHWRQDDPGVIPAGDIHGTGSPTGVTFYENGALGSEYAGTFFSAEARARIIQSYKPELSSDTAEVALGKRSNFLTCENVMFRPSDIMVGADGALYVADWYDSGVGGHKAEDLTHSGAIYRIAPKGFSPELPEMNGDPLVDAVTLLKNPSSSVRHPAFMALKEMGEKALPAVSRLLQNEDEYLSARAVWLLPYLGEEGIKMCRERLENDEAGQRILAFRALRAAGHDVIEMGEVLVADESFAVRRELAVALRDLDPEAKLPLVVQLFESSDGSDRYYLEACGLAAEEIEEDVWAAIGEAENDDPVEWTESYAWNTWRLLPRSAVPGLIKRAKAEALSYEARKQAMETLAFIGSREAVDLIADLASGESDLQKDAAWWLINRGLSVWEEFGTREILKERDIYNPETVEVQTISVPDPVPSTLPAPAELLQLSGDPASGKIQASRCVMCHRIDGVGVEYGPDLLNWVANQGKEAFFEAVIHPSAGIAHGYQGFSINLKDGGVVEGLVFSRLDPVVVVSTGGLEQLIPKSRIKNMKKMWEKSLMMSADQLGFTAQDLADLAAYLETYHSED
ncbi:MAG: dehydrogenase [Verrucomicrobiales bacterium]|nr:dehydrogenase [Verrucomicrobiales bacterium]